MNVLGSILEPILVPLIPIQLLCVSLFFLPLTLYHSILNSPKTLSSWSSIKHAWFARFWRFFGPNSKIRAAPAIQPLLAQHARGTVLDIGTGQGHFLSLYPKDRITKIYAVEPNKSHHPELLANAKAAGLLDNDQFEILDAFIETLSEPPTNLSRGSVDTITTLQVLCSIPNPDVLIPEIRTYLKPNGGKWIAYEHMRRPERNGVLVLWQRALNVVWPQCFNGCNLTRTTQEWIERSGSWKKTSSGGGLAPLDTDSAWSVIPTVIGVLESE